MDAVKLSINVRQIIGTWGIQERIQDFLKGEEGVDVALGTPVFLLIY